MSLSSVPIGGFSSSRGLTFSFTANSDCLTSAGVYDSSDRLIRTLWRGSAVQAGPVTRHWDGKDDSGATAATGTYTIKVLQSNVQHIWDGCVGNTSYIANDHQQMHTAFDLFSCMVTVGTNVYYAVGGNEGQNTFGGFTNTTPQINNQIPAPFVDVFASPYIMALDSQRLYFVSYGGFNNSKSFLYAIELGTGARTGFSSGTNLCLNYIDPPANTVCYPSQSYPGAISLNTGYTNVPSGIAVQQGGSVLAVAMPSEGVIRRYNKLTGASLPNIATSLIPNPAPYINNGNPEMRGYYLNQIAMTSGDELWVITSKTSVAKYTNLATIPTLATSFNVATVNPLAITVDPTNGSIWIVDGGTSQQVKNFSSTGTLLRTVGQQGGSLSNATITGDKFNFYADSSSQKSAITVDSTGSVWVTDSGNGRMLKFGAASTAIESIQYRGKSYNAIVDTGNPTRVFSNFLEYSIDYSKPLTDAASWTLVRNWLPVIPLELQTSDIAKTPLDNGGFINVVTLTNNRTYAQFMTGSYTHTNGARNPIYVILELMADGTTRRVPDIVGSPLGTSVNPIGQYAPATATYQQLYADGSLGYAINENAMQKVARLQLQGFDTSNNPIWNPLQTTVASIPLNVTGWENTPQYSYYLSGIMGPYFPVTAGNKAIYFNGDANRNGLHLGGVTVGGSDWSWKASPSGVLDFKGAFGTKTYAPTLDYAGNNVHVSGRNVFYGYQGERYYLDNQASQFMHFYDNGLFVGQFGVPSWAKTETRQPGFAGNSFGWNLATYANTLYLYCSDESTFGAVNRWKILNTDTIVVLSGSGTVGSTIVVA